MKKLFVAIFAVLLGLSSAYAEGISKKGMAGNLEVEYKSAKPLAMGMNMFTITVKQNGQIVKDAKVSMKVSMPEMTGMPAMESDADVMNMGDSYMAHVTLSMRGTWQVSIIVETKDGKKQRLKSSVNL